MKQAACCKMERENDFFIKLVCQMCNNENQNDTAITRLLQTQLVLSGYDLLGSNSHV
jgi:hypothetical protein